ncbi:MAG TPA: hypothetical protein VMM77_04620 [Gemmatimonadaceae bacterium]|nr:hypothetical protein [Gemmatimonadaceae bacterium]
MSAGVSASVVATTAHLALSILLIVWTILVAGRIARRRDASATLLMISGLGGLLIAPAAFVEGMAGSVTTGRALSALVWLWPATCLVILLQAVYATARGYVGRPLGTVIVVYDLLVAAMALVRYDILLGGAPIEPLVAMSAAGARALDIAASAAATGHPFFLFPPVLAPAVPARSRGLGVLVRSGVAIVITVWSTLLLLAIAPAWRAATSFRPFARERLQERPAGDLAIGARLFSVVDGLGPQDHAVTRDVSLARELGLTALSVFIAPGAASDALTDSLASAVEGPRQAGAVLIAVLAAGDDRGGALPADAAGEARLAREIELIVRRLRPEYLVPVAPAAIAAHPGPATDWIPYLRSAADVAHRSRPATRVMLPLSGFSSADSTLYVWARGPASPIDAVGFRLRASVHGGAGVEARLLAAERWMRLTAGSPMEHWLLEVGAWPAVFGDHNQERAIWGALAWASRQPSVRGVVVHAAADYGAPVGLRTVSGRIRPAGVRMGAAVRAFDEAAERAEPVPAIR